MVQRRGEYAAVCGRPRHPLSPRHAARAASAGSSRGKSAAHRSDDQAPGRVLQRASRCGDGALADVVSDDRRGLRGLLRRVGGWHRVDKAGAGCAHVQRHPGSQCGAHESRSLQCGGRRGSRRRRCGAALQDGLLVHPARRSCDRQSQRPARHRRRHVRCIFTRRHPLDEAARPGAQRHLWPDRGPAARR